MEFPQEVSDYLQRSYVAATSPVCLLVDAEYRLHGFWGDAAWCGMDRLQLGTTVLDVAPFLYGLLDHEPSTVDHVSTVLRLSTAEPIADADHLATADGNVLTVHTIPTSDDRHYVVLLDAKQQHDPIRQRQQSVNELRLLHASQQRLIARQRDLIGELVEAKAELDHIRQEAERSSDSKSRFIAMMSHEFRTPLASIINYAELAREPHATESDISRSVETIARSSRHLTALVDAVLEEARLDSGQVEVRAVDFNLQEMLEDLTAMMAPLAAEKELSFASLVDPKLPTFVCADNVKLRQILINLVGNAVKFTAEGGITITTTYADGRLVASVTDTGPGISVDDQERVFKAFERGGSEVDATGAGLGLTISLRLAQLMGGEISLDSIPGQGCTVALNLPVVVATSDSRNDALSAPPEESFASRPVSVLICDDDEDMLALVEFYLHRAGYGLIATSSGADAVAKTLEFDPDIVLLDYNLPGTSGVECARTLRNGGYSKPIVALTASNLSDAERQQFTTCVRKGESMHRLLTEIKQLTH
ncbi:MAG: ATP-binding protein [Pseudomonadota bacterium]